MEENKPITQITPPIKAGRKSTITDDVVAKLETALQRGLSITKACQYARCSRDAYYRLYADNEAFRNKMLDAQQFISLVAATNVTDSIVREKNVENSKWWLERKEPEQFGKRPLLVQQNNTNVTNNQTNYVPTADSEVLSGFRKLFTEAETVHPIESTEADTAPSISGGAE